MKITNEINFKEAIIKIKILDDGSILIVNSRTEVRILDIHTLDIIDGFSGHMFHFEYENHSVDFTSCGSYYAVLDTNFNEAILCDTKTSKIPKKINNHRGKLTCVAIEPKNKYVFSCGRDGKVFAMDIKNNELSFSLPSHCAAVNTIAFSKDGNWVATAGVDRKIQIFSMVSMVQECKLLGHKEAVKTLHFLNEERILSVDEKNNVIIWNYYNGEQIIKLKEINDVILRVSISSDNKFLFLGTKSGNILAYDLKTYKLLLKSYINLGYPITALNFSKNNMELIVGTKNGDLFFYDIYGEADHIKTLFKEQKHETIEKLISKNPLLAYTPIYELISNFWEVTVKKAIISLERGDTEVAQKLFSNFTKLPDKNTIIKKIMFEYLEFDKFIILVKADKLSSAYALADKYPTYKNSKIYKDMERKWKKVFLLSQKYAIDSKGFDMTRTLLSPYRGIGQKSKLIQELLTKNTIHQRFHLSISQKEFKTSFKLANKNPFLKELEEYKNLIKYADSLYIQSCKFLKKNDTYSAIKILRILIDFDNYQEVAKELIYETNNKQKFFSAIKDDNIVMAYNLLYKDKKLLKTVDGNRLQQEWHADLFKANKHVLNGDIKGLTITLEKYLKIKSKNIALSNIYGLCYINQLEKALENPNKKNIIEDGIKQYILFFGIQDQINSFFDSFKDSYPESKLNINLQKKGSSSMWRPSMIVNSILE